MTTEDRLLNLKEAMLHLRVSRSTIYRLMWAGQLQGYKVGTGWRFYARDLDAAIRVHSIAIWQKGGA